MLKAKSYQPKKLINLINNCDFDKAVTTIQKLLKTNSQDAFLYKMLAKVFYYKQDYQEAIAILKQSYQLKPDTEVLSMLCLSMWEERVTIKNASETIYALLDANLKLQPDDYFLLHTKALLYSYEKQFDKAINIAEQLYRSNDYSKTYKIVAMLSDFYTYVGRFDDARRLCEDLFEKAPMRIDLCARLAQLKNFSSVDDPFIEHLKTLKDKPGTQELPKALVYFSLADIYHKLKLYDLAFENYSLANQIMARLKTFDSSVLKKSYDALADCLLNRGTTLPETLSSQDFAPIGFKPVFIVGMPRSGSSLLEQILASHSKVVGIGESDALLVAFQDSSVDTSKSYRDFYENLDLETVNSIRIKFKNYVHRDISGSIQDYVVNKNLFNYKYLWLIKAVFPEAKIIHTTRDPVSTLWSCFKINFSKTVMNFTFKIQSLIDYYDIYRQFMKLWCQVYEDAYYELNYENLVDDFDNQLSRLLEYLGLDLEQTCLEFYKQDAIVATASKQQARLPLYSSAKQSWLSYEKHLQPLLNKLKELSYV